MGSRDDFPGFKERTEKRLLKDYFDDNDAVFSVFERPVCERPETGTMSNCRCEKQDCEKKDCAEKNCEELTRLDNPDLNRMPLAMAYVPMQKFECLHTEENALAAGTLFKALDLPFSGSDCGREQR